MIQVWIQDRLRLKLILILPQFEGDLLEFLGHFNEESPKKNKVNGKQTRENVSFTCKMAFGFCLKMTDLEHVWLQPPQVIIFPMLFDQFLPAPSAAKKVLIKDEDATTQSSTRPERLSMPCHSM
jgi:hypothetical protein